MEPPKNYLGCEYDLKEMCNKCFFFFLQKVAIMSSDFGVIRELNPHLFLVQLHRKRFCWEWVIYVSTSQYVICNYASLTSHWHFLLLFDK